MQLINETPSPLVSFAWTVRDNEYVYMDTWVMPQEEWDALSPEDIEQRQVAQYNAWRNYMANPGE